MFSFRETNFRLVDLFDWEYARMQFLLSVSRNRYGFALVGYRKEKSATDPALEFTEIMEQIEYSYTGTKDQQKATCPSLDDIGQPYRIIFLNTIF